MAGRYLVTSNLTIGGAYTYLFAEESTGFSEVRRPKHTARADLNYLFADGRGNLNIAAIYNGTMSDNGFLNAPPFSQRVLLDDYWLVNAAVSYKLQPGVEVFGRVENILDQRYQEVLGYNSTPGAAAFAGFKLTFGGTDGIGSAGTK